MKQISTFLKKKARDRRVQLLGAILLVAALLTGCQTAGYYQQAIRGQYEILARQQPLARLIADPKTPDDLKRKLELILELRRFAETELGLPAKGHYLKYADLKRSHVVWSIQATPEFSFTSKTWWYPVVGHASYRGYFSESAARKHAARLEKEGWDVFVSGVGAYSTLGWFHDPVLNTFISRTEAELAELIFHELAHQRLFVPGDTEFNEAFATAVGEEGVRRWFAARGRTAVFEEHQAEARRNAEFVGLVLETRNRLDALYRDTAQPEAFKREQKTKLIAQFRDEYNELKAAWGGIRDYDPWVALPINNAQLNTISTYYDLVPAFQRLLEMNDGDLGQFYAAARQLGARSREQRTQFLTNLAREPQVAATGEKRSDEAAE